MTPAEQFNLNVFNKSGTVVIDADQLQRYLDMIPDRLKISDVPHPQFGYCVRLSKVKQIKPLTHKK